MSRSNDKDFVKMPVDAVTNIASFLPSGSLFQTVSKSIWLSLLANFLNHRLFSPDAFNHLIISGISVVTGQHLITSLVNMKRTYLFNDPVPNWALICLTGDVALIKSKIDTREIDEKSQISNGRNPLHFAVLSGKTEAVAAVLDSFPHLLNSVDTKGNTALHIAAAAQLLNVMKYLVSRHINVTKNTLGYSVLDCVNSGGRASAEIRQYAMQLCGEAPQLRCHV